MTEARDNRGLIASGVLHAVLIGLALFGGPLFDAEDASAIQIAEVDLISGAEFDAAASSAPEAPRDPLAPTEAPQEAQDQDVTPDADSRPDIATSDRADAPDARDERPTPDAPDEPLAPVEAKPTPDAPDQIETADAAPEGLSDLSVPAPVGPQNLEAPLKPDQTPDLDATPPKRADRIAPTPSAAPEVITRDEVARPEQAPSDVARAVRPQAKPSARPETAPNIDTSADTEEQAPAPAPAPVEAAPAPKAEPDRVDIADAAPSDVNRPRQEQQKEAAPPETTTKIVTEADEPAEEVGPAPIASAPPRGRPKSIVAQAEAAKKAAEETKTAAAASETGANTSGERTPRRETSAPLGPKLTRGEIEGVRIGLKKTWRIDRVLALPNYEQVVITVRFSLSKDGKVTGQPKMIKPRSAPDNRFKIAFQAARIAIMRAAPFRLPPEKYGRWKTIEVTFNPRKGVFF